MPDGRITQDGMLKILDEIKCDIWASPDGQNNLPKDRTHLVIPSLDDILEQCEDDYVKYPYNEAWEQGKNEVVCIIHTSGTTGKSEKSSQIDKPIILTPSD